VAPVVTGWEAVSHLGGQNTTDNIQFCARMWQNL